LPYCFEYTNLTRPEEEFSTQEEFKESALWKCFFVIITPISRRFTVAYEVSRPLYATSANVIPFIYLFCSPSKYETGLLYNNSHKAAQKP
jgi:hypothetical protein